MKFSQKWLQEYIVETLPQSSVIESVLNAKAFEVEGVEKIDNDTIYDIKVLPNRAHDALGHIGMTRELSACLGLTFKNIENTDIDKNESDDVGDIKVEVKDTKACTRFMAVRIDNISVGESPAWLREKLESIDQKSINNIVDITNYVQYTLNKPMHAYDARNIIGGLQARYANENEILLTLDDKELTLDTRVLVIADDEKALGLAGIKGGKHSGVKSDTTSVILESANFNPTLIRKTSQKYNIKTDASKRFENGIADTLVEDGLMMTVSEICKLFPEAKVGVVTDVDSQVASDYSVWLTLQDINDTLGSDYSETKVESTLNSLGFTFEKINTLDYIKDNYEKLLGAKYKSDASMRLDAPEYFSCSSLISYLFKGVWMPSISIDKYVFSKKINVTKSGDKYDLSSLKFGDLIFANSGEGVIRYESEYYMKGTKVESGIDHVGMYIGDNKVLHATKVKGCVLVESFEDFCIGRSVTYFGRVTEDLNMFRYIINVPSERLDLRIKEDIIEEIGRIDGYEKLTPTLPNLKNKIGKISKHLHCENIVRNILNTKGYFEAITYSLTDKGDIKILKSASDKSKMRTNISDGLVAAVTKNIFNMPLLNVDLIKMYEFGSVFTLGNTKESPITETLNLAISIDDGKKKSNFSEEIEALMSEIKTALGLTSLDFQVTSQKPYTIEVNFDKLIKGIGDEYSNIENKNVFLNVENKNIKYKHFSQMPFIARDVAFWCDVNTDKVEVASIIKENAGELCVSVNIFDEFTKDIEGKMMKSLAYRLIYQDESRTLTDDEVNTYADNVYNTLKNKNFEIR